MSVERKECEIIIERVEEYEKEAEALLASPATSATASRQKFVRQAGRIVELLHSLPVVS